MTIPYFSLQLAPEKLRETWTKAIRDVIESGIVINGNSVATFEESWSKAIGTEFAVGVSNGLDGLVLSLIALGIGPGSNVAVPAHTFIATWNAIYEVGANAIGVEVNELGLLDTENLEITCKENKIDIVLNSIESHKKLKYLDCSTTSLNCDILGILFPKLEHLVCNNSNITTVMGTDNLTTLEMCNTKISKLDYFRNLTLLIVECGANIDIDETVQLSSLERTDVRKVKSEVARIFSLQER